MFIRKAEIILLKQPREDSNNVLTEIMNKSRLLNHITMKELPLKY